MSSSTKEVVEGSQKKKEGERHSTVSAIIHGPNCGTTTPHYFSDLHSPADRPRASTNITYEGSIACTKDV